MEGREAYSGKMLENKIQSLLISLGLCTPESIQEFYPRVRDREDVRVMRCNDSGVIFLSRSDHLSESHYQDQSGLDYWSVDDRKKALADCYEDDCRRAQQFGDLIRGRRWLDVGTGVGGILDLLSPQAAEVCAVEPQPAVRQELIQSGYQVYASIDEVADEYFDVVSLFHVLEHFPRPIEALRTIRKKMKAGASLIVEVPHADDVLIKFFDLERFKAFTFWSEHLILHTRRSLDTFLREAGFADIRLTGHQRYPLANHFHWLSEGEPGGHHKWQIWLDPELDRAYSAKLEAMNSTDTLIAVVTK